MFEQTKNEKEASVGPFFKKNMNINVRICCHWGFNHNIEIIQTRALIW